MGMVYFHRIHGNGWNGIYLNVKKHIYIYVYITYYIYIKNQPFMYSSLNTGRYTIHSWILMGDFLRLEARQTNKKNIRHHLRSSVSQVQSFKMTVFFFRKKITVLLADEIPNRGPVKRAPYMSQQGNL